MWTDADGDESFHVNGHAKCFALEACESSARKCQREDGWNVELSEQRVFAFSPTPDAVFVPIVPKNRRLKNEG